MKNRPKKTKAIIISLISCAALVILGLHLVSHLYYHRSLMASFAEWYMMIIDRDAIYSDSNEYRENLEIRREDNLKDQDIPAGVHMDIPYTFEHEYGMQVYYFNKECLKENDTILLYIPGGGYLNPPLKYHWKLINTLSQEADCTVVMPIYLKVPNYTADEAYKAMLDFYRDLSSREGINRIVVAGDSSGGGMSLVLSQILRDDYPDLLQPEELILIAPWMDVSMDNEHICEYEPVDPMLDIYGAKEIGKMWAGERDVHDPMVSPIYGNFENLGHMTIFIGTRDMLCPDCLEFSDILTEKGIEHTLFVREGLDHPYPLFPTPEAKEAQQMMIDILKK